MTGTPQQIARKGGQLYQELFRDKYEKDYTGQYLAIDVTNAEAHVAETPEAAIEAAQKANPDGYFHLIKIGGPGVYRIGSVGRQEIDWIF